MGPRSGPRRHEPSARTRLARESIGKVALSNVAQLAAHAHSTIGGADGMLNGPDAPFDGMIAEVLVSVPAQSIAGGTDEMSTTS